MTKVPTEISAHTSGERARRLFLLCVLSAGSLVLVRAIPALSGDVAGAARAKEFSGGGSAGRGEFTTADELVSGVISNELTDRQELLKWIFVIEKRAGKETLTQEQVETQEGPLYRLLAIDGTALNPVQREQDDARIGRLMKDPSPLQKLKQAQKDDEQKLQKLLSLMPHAFLYDYDGAEENLVRVKFRPNPDYIPASYEERVIHNLAGTMLIDPDRKRMTKIAGSLVSRVDFGYGLLGRMDSGTVEIGRVEVGPRQWKTAFINIHFSGRVVLFKTVSKDQYEKRSEFREVARDLSLSDGRELLDSRRLSAMKP